MAFDGVLAFQGKDHITASQLGRIVEGVAGKGRYVLPTLNQMTAKMQTANKVRVGTGDLVMDGRVVTNEAAVDLTVESGMSGYKRNDLVVCRYTKNASTGVENFAAEVVKGTPTTGTAADPEVTEGDISTGSASAVMPLWRIPLNGITPGAPVRIAPVASTLKTLGDSVSPVVLFNNRNIGFTDVVTLSQDPSKFARVEFTCVTDDNEQFTVDYVPGLGTTRFVASCARVNFGSGQVFLKTRAYEVSGRTVNTANDIVNGNKCWHSGQVTVPGGSLSNGDRIKIVRAVGYMS